jgi:SAM-dependent methyltransferase
MSTSDVTRHYETLLAEHYTWMMGGIEACLAKARGLIELAGLADLPAGQTALDLGCGPGYHARALAERGLRVVAVDTSPLCLAELATLCAGLPVTSLSGDLTDRATYAARGPFAAVLCVGDTLPHLASVAEVAALLQGIPSLLLPGGVLLLEFREQNRELAGPEAVLTTRSGRDRIMQCVLHYEPDRVQVTDVLHEWNGEAWARYQGSYHKLRLTGERVVELVIAAGLHVRLDTTHAGQRTLLFSRAGQLPA